LLPYPWSCLLYSTGRTAFWPQFRSNLTIRFACSIPANCILDCTKSPTPHLQVDLRGLIKRIPERRTRSAGQLSGAGIKKDAKSEANAHHPWTVPHIHSIDLPNLVPTADKLVFLPEHPPSHMSLSNFAEHVSSPTFPRVSQHFPILLKSLFLSTWKIIEGFLDRC
jgi:hypothetical protein